jgi:6-pyruvoyl-tetrahydropterin synthase
MGITVKKKFEVSYGHILPRYNGKCGRDHGHNAVIEFEFKKPSQYEDYPGLELDFGMIKMYVKPILEKYIDHHHLNYAEHIKGDLDAIKHFNCCLDEETGEYVWSTTAENIVQFLAAKVKKTPIGDGLVSIRFWETSNSSVEYRI